MKKMTSLFTAAFLAIGLLISQAPAMAQSVDAKIITVDFDRVTRDALVAKDVAAQLQKERLAIEARANNLQTSLQAERQALESQRNIIAQEAFQQKAQEWEAKGRQAQQEVASLNQRLQASAQQANLEIQRGLRPIIQDVMTQKGATMVLDKALVYHSVGGMDVTTEVIDLLNQKMTTYQIQSVNAGGEAAAPTQN